MKKTTQEKWESRRIALRKYRISEKNKIVQRRYQKTHREQLSKTALNWVHRNKKHVLELARRRNATPRGKALIRASQKRYAEKNRIKRLAKDAIHNAIKAGKLKRQNCVKCGNPKSEGHHPDYTKPLEVIWLCKKCHIDLHKNRTVDDEALQAMNKPSEK